jgi:precorrin-4/cobalt-precorrin-4 C11-methyltransferase
MNDTERHPVVFVGAGPGDPELITVAGMRALEAADLVVYAGSLVSRDMLQWTKPDTRHIDSAGLNLKEIVDHLAEGHEKGLRVVRLHTGDPSLYGAVAEQFRILNERKVPYRVIPGVTAAFAAAAALKMEFTLPETCQTLILTRIAGRTPVPETEDLGRLAESKASLAIYLSAGKAEDVAAKLTPSYGEDAPVAVVYRASWPDEKIMFTTLRDLAKDMAEAKLDRQALILVGPALAESVREQAPDSKLYDAGFSHEYRKGRP